MALIRDALSVLYLCRKGKTDRRIYIERDGGREVYAWLLHNNALEADATERAMALIRERNLYYIYVQRGRPVDE